METVTENRTKMYDVSKLLTLLFEDTVTFPLLNVAEYFLNNLQKLFTCSIKLGKPTNTNRR